MLIGEAPGELETNLKLPFQGRSGQLLNNLLERAGIDRKEIFIANIVCCQPPNNDIKHVDVKEALRVCPELYLLPKIKEINPKVIILMGNTAHKYFFRSEGILKSRGVLRLWNGYKVVPTLHPAFLLRGNNQYNQHVIKDLIYAKSLLEEQKETLSFKVIETEQDFDLMIANIKDSTKIAVDTETTGLNPYSGDCIIGISFSKDRNFGYYLPYKEKSWFGNTYTYKWNDEYNQWIKDYLENPYARKAFHNANFDIEFLSVAENIEVQGLVIDTLVVGHLLNENRSNSLENLSNIYYPDMVGYKERSKSFLNGEKDFTKLPLKVLAERGALDAIATYRLSEDLLSELRQDTLLLNYYINFQLPLIPVLIDIQKYGFRVDTEAAKKLKIKYEHKLEDLKNKIWELAGYKFNINSGDQLGELFIKLKFPILKTTEKSNQPSTDKEALNLIKKETDHPIIDLLLEYSKIEKLYSTYIIGMIDKAIDGSIHCKLNITGTDTSRLSSKNPNQQNISGNKEIKNLIIAKKGYKLLQMDASQAEVRVLSFHSDDNSLISACTSADVYTTMANMIFNRKDITKSSPERKHSKMVTLATLYGMGSASLSKSLNIPEVRAKSIQRKFFETFKNSYEWILQTKRYVHSHGYIRTVYGRVRRLPNINSNDNEKVAEAERQAVNTMIQSSTSDYITTALRRVHTALKDFDGHIVITVHDSIIVEIKEEQVEAFIPIMKRHMTEPVLPINVPMAVEVAVGDKWGDLEISE